MHSMSFSQIAKALRVKPLQQTGNPAIEWLLTDSRKMITPETTLFFAISSPYKNAQQFIEELYNKNVRNFIIEDEAKLNLKNFSEANIIALPDTQKALQKLAIFHRNKYHYPVIGITGSNGKTMVKEWLFQLLGDKFNITRSPRSFNSKTGVPLSVWQMDDAHNLAIFEAGISTTNEMEKLQPIIKPGIGIITFIGDAHAEGFETVAHKIEEKLLLFTKAELLIYCKDDELLDKKVAEFIATKNTSLQKVTWSRRQKADLKVLNETITGRGTEIAARWKNKLFKYFIPFTDKASIHNANTCCCVLLQLGISLPLLKQKMQDLQQVEMRLELKEGIHNCTIINDRYSADINSLNIALDFLSQHTGHPNHTVILSDLLQAGLPAEQLYKTIAAILAGKKLYRFVGIGPEILKHQQLFKHIRNLHFFHSTEIFLQSIASLKFKDETILLKAARVFQFEKISQALEHKNHKTVLEINLNALRHNFLLYKKLVSPAVKLMAMVKAFSYGSGSFQVASLLQQLGADYLAVAYADEGVELRRAGIHLPIMVMNTETAAFENMLVYNLQPEIYSFKILIAFKNYLSQQAITHYPVHIKLDTGMHRLGFEKNDIAKLVKHIKEDDSFHLVSVFSHLVASEDAAEDNFTSHQFALFTSMADEIELGCKQHFIRHIANTAAIHRHKAMQMDLVRLGIGLYGINRDNAIQKKLQNVTTLKTTISQIRQVKKGESVGYNRQAVMQKNSSIATVRIGYADGYPRSLGNGKGSMLVNGILAPVTGHVCMDMTMIDITGIAAQEDDEVIVFGEALPVATLAAWGSTIPYEILTNVSQRVKRVYYEE